MFTTILALTGMLSGLGALALGWYTLSRTREVGGEFQALAQRRVEASASGADPLAVRDVAVLHYDALEEMSGARSFSMALLNSEGDGVVVTSINGRTESRTYAKPVVAWDSDILLSPEEYRVVRSARLGEGVGATMTAGSSPVGNASVAPVPPADSPSSGSPAPPNAESGDGKSSDGAEGSGRRASAKSAAAQRSV